MAVLSNQRREAFAQSIVAGKSTKQPLYRRRLQQAGRSKQRITCADTHADSKSFTALSIWRPTC